MRTEPPLAIELERHGRRDGDVFAALGRLGPRATAGPTAAAEQLGQDVGIDIAAAPGRKPAGAEVEAEVAEIRPSGTLAEALELGRPRFPFGVDFAAIKGPALLVVAKDFISRANLGEPIFGLGLLALVGMVLLGEPAKSGLDLRRGRRLRHAKHVIRIAHTEPILRRPPLKKREAPLSPPISGSLSRAMQVRGVSPAPYAPVVHPCFEV